MLRICGQLAALLPKSVMVGYGRGSETERKLGLNEELAILMTLNTQSNPVAKVIGISYVLFLLKKIIQITLTI